jgi:hypothetical protein
MQHSTYWLGIWSILAQDTTLTLGTLVSIRPISKNLGCYIRTVRWQDVSTWHTCEDTAALPHVKEVHDERNSYMILIQDYAQDLLLGSLESGVSTSFSRSPARSARQSVPWRGITTLDLLGQHLIPVSGYGICDRTWATVMPAVGSIHEMSTRLDAFTRFNVIVPLPPLFLLYFYLRSPHARYLSVPAFKR